MTAPVAIPSLADMPSLDTVPVCERELLDPDSGPCAAQARWRMTLAHLDLRPCAPTAVLACDEHRDRVELDTRDFVDSLSHISICGHCGKRIRHRGDLIRSVVAL